MISKKLVLNCYKYDPSRSNQNVISGIYYKKLYLYSNIYLIYIF